jgi:hypothetical protein
MPYIGEATILRDHTRSKRGYAMATRTIDSRRDPREATARIAQRDGSSSVGGGEGDLASQGVHLLGFWSARTILLIEVIYIAVFIAGFASIRNTSKPLPDPYLAIAEILILLMAPVMVCLMLAVNECAPRHAKPFTRVALGWMLAAAAFTTVVHFVQLTVARHISSATFPGYASIFGWKWPSTFYSVDIVAWDVFFGFGPAVCRPGVCGPDRCNLGATRPHPQRLDVLDRSGRPIRQHAWTAHNRHRRLHDRLRTHLSPAQQDVPGNTTVARGNNLREATFACASVRECHPS